MSSPRLTVRDLGYTPGILPTGPTNSILDVPGVHISQITVPTPSPSSSTSSTATKGLTVISPRPPSKFYVPCPASSFTLNGNGELTCSRQIADWGFTNTPIAFTNSLSLGTVFDGIWDWILDKQDELGWDSLTKARHYGTPVVGETADWIINGGDDVRKSRLEEEDIRRCLEDFKSREDGGEVQEGQEGGGAGMTCHMFAGGTGTSSRVLPGVGGDGKEKEYTLGVLCQSNYGVLSDLVIGGVPIGKLLKKEQVAQDPTSTGDEGSADVHAASQSQSQSQLQQRKLAGRAKDGSILILIITDAPLATHQLNRLARHATVGLGQVGAYGVGKTFSGDIFLALSTAKTQCEDRSQQPGEQLGPEQVPTEELKRGALARPTRTYTTEVVKNESIDAFFYAVAECVEEAVLNSMVGGREGTVGVDGTKIEGLPVEKVKVLLKKYLVKV